MAQDPEYDEFGNPIYTAQNGPGGQVQNPNQVGVGTGVVPPTGLPGPAGGGIWNDFPQQGRLPPAGQPGAPTPTASPWTKDARNTFRDAWMSSGGGDLQNFINTNPAATPYKDQFRVEGDKLYINPTVDDKYGAMGQEVIDAVLDYGPGGQNKPAWTGIGPGSGSAGNNVYPGGMPNSGGMTGGTGSAAGGFVPSGGSALSGGVGGGAQGQAIFDLLMKRANQGEVVDPNDPILKSQVDAYGAQQERARRNYLSGEAERQGANTNLGAETRSSEETVGQNIGAFQGQLMQRELDARRQEIESALSGAAGFLTQEQQMALQEELAKLSLAQQESQFGRSQGQQESQFGRSLAEQAYEADTNQYNNIFG